MEKEKKKERAHNPYNSKPSTFFFSPRKTGKDNFQLHQPRHQYFHHHHPQHRLHSTIRFVMNHNVHGEYHPCSLPAELNVNAEHRDEFQWDMQNRGYTGQSLPSPSQSTEHQEGWGQWRVYFPSGNHPAATSPILFDFRLSMGIILETLSWDAS